MPPLPPNVTKAGLLRSMSGWNNSSLSRRSGTTVGLLSTRTPHSSGNSGGGISNPSFGIGVVREAFPRGATGTWQPINIPQGIDGSYITVTSTGGTFRFYPNAQGQVTSTELDVAYAAAGINKGTTPHTITFGADVNTISTGGDLGANAATALNFPTSLTSGLAIGSDAFRNNNAIISLTFPATLGGAFTIGNHAFHQNTVMTSITFPRSMAGVFTTGIQTFSFNALMTTFDFNATGITNFAIGRGTFFNAPAINVIFPTTITGQFSLANDAFDQATFVGATSSQGVLFPAQVGSSSFGILPFQNANANVTDGTTALNTLSSGVDFTNNFQGKRFFDQTT
jgi:hypothetical protein